MKRAQKRTPPGATVAFGGSTQEASRTGLGQIAPSDTRNPMRECPKVAPELFAARAKAIMAAKTRRELHGAISRYAFAAMWARHQTGRGMDLAREVVIHDAQRYASFSAVRPCLRKRFIAHVVVRMDEAARCAVEGVDA